MCKRRVVITGMGAVTPLGLNVKDSWSAIVSAKHGIKRIERFDTTSMECKIAGELPNFVPSNYIEHRDIKKMDPFIHYGIAAAIEAIADSGWIPQNEHDKARTGVTLGSGIGGLGTIERTAFEYYSHAFDRKHLSPFYIPSALVNLLAGHVAIRYGFTGPNRALATACATGAHAIGDSMRAIQYDECDVIVAGGSEAPITYTGVGGFSAARALTTCFNDNPGKASRPWDKDRSGFVIAEGAGVVVLEEYEHAKARGAKIYAEIVGYAATGDAYHITSLNGQGAYNAMKNALKDAQITPDMIDYINAHGTSTMLGDQVELESVQTLFKGNHKVKMSSTKSATGHLLGAAGSVEVIWCALAIQDQIAPPTLNLYNPIDSVEIDLVPMKAKNHSIDYVLTNSFGFGGTNASIVLKKNL